MDDRARAIPVKARGALLWLGLRLVFGVSWIQAALATLPDTGWMQTAEAPNEYLETYVTMQQSPRPRITIDAIAFDWSNAFPQGLLDTEAYVANLNAAVQRWYCGVSEVLGVEAAAGKGKAMGAKKGAFKMIKTLFSGLVVLAALSLGGPAYALVGAQSIPAGSPFLVVYLEHADNSPA